MKDWERGIQWSNINIHIYIPKWWQLWWLVQCGCKVMALSSLATSKHLIPIEEIEGSRDYVPYKDNGQLWCKDTRLGVMCTHAGTDQNLDWWWYIIWCVPYMLHNNKGLRMAASWMWYRFLWGILVTESVCKGTGWNFSPCRGPAWGLWSYLNLQNGV